MVSGGTGSMPKLRSWKLPPLPFFTWVSLTALDPRSRPMQFFAITASPLGGAAIRPRLLVFLGISEHHDPVLRLQAKRFEDLPFRIHASPHPTLDPIHGQGREACSPCELGLAHHPLHAQLADVVLHL